MMIDRKTLEALVVHLKKGEVALLPFDTCYGLVCDGTNPNACTKLYQLKQRSRTKPAALVVPSVDAVLSYAAMSPSQEGVLRRLMPGKVTAIVRLKEGVEFPRGYVQTQYDTASFRVVKSNLINTVLERFGKPLLATSANLDGHPVILSKTDYIMHPFNKERSGRIFALVEEVYERPAHSTVIDLTTDDPEIVRPGAVPDIEIKQAA